MDMTEQQHLATQGLGGELRLNEPMRKHTSWRAGGPAQRAYKPRDLDDLACFLRSLPADEPLYPVGLGSNLLVRDAGVRGTVVFLHGALTQVRVEPSAPLIYAEAGVASPKVARLAVTHGLRGAEFLAGIPGTVGGALAMNAGCYGSETWDIVDSVLVVTRQGELQRRAPSQYQVAYRHVSVRGANGVGPVELFAAAWLRLTPGDGEEGRRVIKDLLQRRIASQPLEQPNAGSVFRNPPGDYAARLIEACGLKGRAIGGAMVSPKHANFIVNTGIASAADIEALIELVQRTVEARFGVRLEREVRIIGERLQENRRGAEAQRDAE
jgi:UDP-N-acetylmuramate dehydrogenase